MANETNSPALGLTGHIALVHRKDAEGVLQIDAVTGQVLPGQHDRPDWAEGLVMAMLAERHIFYASRLGEDAYTAEMRNPEVFAFEDLEWLALKTSPEENGADDEYVVEADSEHRMDVIAAALGINRETGEVADVLAEIEVASDNFRSQEELDALIAAQAQGFEAATGTR